jgi:hypothetical protein
MTRNLVSPEQAEANRGVPGAYTFNAYPPDDYDGIAFTLAVLRLGDHAHIEVNSGRAVPQPDGQQRLPRSRAGRLILRWHEWEVLRAILGTHDCIRIAEVERPTQEQLEYHHVGVAA